MILCNQLNKCVLFMNYRDELLTKRYKKIVSFQYILVEQMLQYEYILKAKAGPIKSQMQPVEYKRHGTWM